MPLAKNQLQFKPTWVRRNYSQPWLLEKGGGLYAACRGCTRLADQESMNQNQAYTAYNMCALLTSLFRKGRKRTAVCTWARSRTTPRQALPWNPYTTP